MTKSREADAARRFLSQYSLEWLAFSGAHKIFHNSAGEVVAVSVEFAGNNENVPPPEKVIGKSVNAGPDGSQYKRVRHPEAGYWVCYHKTVEGNPKLKITVQKMG